MKNAVDVLTLPDFTEAPVETPALVTPEIPTVETERDQFAKARAIIVDALRANGDKQIKGEIFNGDKFCFVGCAVKALGNGS